MVLTINVPANAEPLSVIPAIPDAEWTEDWWQARHQQKLEEVNSKQKKIELVFLGDSITHAWEQGGKSTWQQYYGHRNAVNLGFSGDRTEHVLWRLQNGEIDNISPKLVVLMIGTNNIGHRQDPPKEIAQGISVIIETLKQKLPTTKILLLAIFPRGETLGNIARTLTIETNSLIKPLADNKVVFWRDLTHLFVNEKQQIETHVMPDFLHPTPEQYPRWAEAMEPDIKKILGK